MNNKLSLIRTNLVMKKFLKILVYFLVSLPFFCFCLINVQAASSTNSNKTQIVQYGSGAADSGITQANQFGPKSAEELESFLDIEIPRLMQEYHIPGFMISFVSGDNIIFNKGYGVKKVETKKAINPTTDVSLVASVAKTLVTTAVMQQVDRGKIKLDEDINIYLNFEIKNDFKEKITIRNLLQNTAGFEDYFNGQGTKDKDKLITLEESVKNYRPKVVYKPGDIHNYSNYGWNLLGYIVQRTSGQEFDQYVKENIFLPLEMNSSLFAYNLPSADFGDTFLKGYIYNLKDDKFVEQETGYWAGYPAYALLSNTHDLGNFMIMYLNDGIFKGKTILKPESVKSIENDVFAPHKDLLGQGLGFMINEINGHKTVEKSGGAFGSTGQVILFPEYKQGISYSFNSNIIGFNYDFQKAFADRFYPNVSQSSKCYPMSMSDLKKFEGYYRYTRYNQSGIAKLMVAISPQHNAFVKANEDGTLSVGIMFLKDSIKYEPISADSFQKVEKTDILAGSGIKIDLGKRMAFRLNAKKDKADYVFFNFEKLSMERIPWWQYGTVSILALLFFVVTSLLILICWSIGKLISILRKKHQIASWQKIASSVGMAYAVTIIVFFGIIFFKFNEDLMYGIPLILKVALIVPTLSIPAFLSLGYFSIKSWQKKYWNLPTRILYSLFALSVLVFVCFSAFYNLIGWNY